MGNPNNADIVNEIRQYTKQQVLEHLTVEVDDTTVLDTDTANAALDILADLQTDGSGTGAVTVRDAANAQDIARFEEGSETQLAIPETSQLAFSDITGRIDSFTVGGGGLVADMGNAGRFRIDNNTNSGLFVVTSSGEVKLFNGSGMTYKSPDPGAQTLMDITVTDDGDGSGNEHSYGFQIDGTDIFRAYAEDDGAGGIQNPGIRVSQPVEDSAGNAMLDNVADTGQVALSSGTAVVDTGLSDTDATFMVAMGIDDPNADAKVASRLFWDDSAGTYKIEFVEDGTSLGNPTVNYDVIRVR